MKNFLGKKVQIILSKHYGRVVNFIPSPSSYAFSEHVCLLGQHRETGRQLTMALDPWQNSRGECSSFGFFPPGLSSPLLASLVAARDCPGVGG